MARELIVDPEGMRRAATGSVAAAADVLAEDRFDGATSGRPSAVGIAAVDAASFEVRARVSDRITGQAGGVVEASDDYDVTDGGNADAIAVTV
ncbi:hypothetical protein [Mycolicibacterium gilvum]|uniref:hypothetical protein n=1 Tax=Mycolicibacterium gilvum TaxID=1804 RepID=UPI0009D6E9CE